MLCKCRTNMSLLTSTNAGNEACDYYIRNLGGNGIGTNPAPCIGGTAVGAVKVGDPTVGMVLRGDASGSGFIRGGGATSVAGSSLTLGASTAQSAQIVMSDTLIQVNAPLTIAGAGNDLTIPDDILVGGNVVFSNNATGASISGYYNANLASASYPDVTDTQIANPPGLTAGWYIYALACAPNSQQEEQVSVIVHYNGTLFDIGGSIRSTAGTGTFGFKPNAARTAMMVQNSTGAAQTAIVFVAKLLN